MSKNKNSAIDKILIDLDDAENMVSLTNKYIFDLTNALNPAKYEKQEGTFINLALNGPVLIAASIINRLVQMYHVDEMLVIKSFIDKLEYHLNIIENQRNDSDTIVKEE